MYAPNSRLMPQADCKSRSGPVPRCQATEPPSMQHVFMRHLLAMSSC
jgi:hypothetical protein